MLKLSRADKTKNDEDRQSNQTMGVPRSSAVSAHVAGQGAGRARVGRLSMMPLGTPSHPSDSTVKL